MMPENLLGLILAGGLSRRMEVGDKSFKELAGQSLLSRVIERFDTQVSEVIINANGDPANFSAFEKVVAADIFEGFAGPLAGVLTGLDWASKNRPAVTHVLTVPCDGPFLALNYAAKMTAAIGTHDIAMAMSNGRTHPVAGLWPVALKDSLAMALEEGVRKVDVWTADYKVALVDFSVLNGIDPFFNANRPGDLEKAEELLRLEIQEKS